LPVKAYEYAEYKKAKVNVDYHVEVDRHYYSVPYQLVRETVWIRKTAHVVEILHRNQRVASHLRSFVKGGYTTISEHMPKSHREYKEWSPDRLVHWAEKNGPQTAGLVKKILATRVHPVQGYRACLGIMRLGKTYGWGRLEDACSRALRTGCQTYGSVESILKKGLDKLVPTAGALPECVIDHEHVRGAGYYRDGSEESNG
jgi:transposase